MPFLPFRRLLVSVSLALPLWGDVEYRVVPENPATRLPEDLDISLFADKEYLADPTAISVDEQNRVFVAETHRWKKQVQDIRRGKNFQKERVEGDITSWTLADREAYHKKWSGKGFMKWEQYDDDAEKIRVVVDQDGDGIADQSSYYRDDFNEPLSGTVGGILVREGSVFFANLPDLFVLHDSDDDGVGEDVQKVATGFGCRVSYSGHDLGGMIFGPDGKLYFSLGDRGYHVEKEGKVFARADSGAVFRCNPDGTEFEVFYHGLRNPKELAFDEFGNLFTVDNDYDHGDSERIIYLIEEGDAGWKMGHQTLSSFGNVVFKHAKLKTRNLKEREDPWMAEQMWKPRQEGQPAFILPPLALAVDGPSGLTYNPGVTGLPARYDRTFFQASFKGSVPRCKIEAFRLTPDGGGFALESHEPFLEGMAVTDFDWGYDGKLYIADFLGGWGRKGEGRLWTVYDEEIVASDEVAELQRLFQEGFAGRSLLELYDLLGHADQRVRQRAQSQIVVHGASDAYPVFAKAAREGSTLLHRLHGLWGVGQLDFEGGDFQSLFRELLGDTEAEVRANAARTLSWNPAKIAPLRPLLIEALQDSSPRVASLAALTLAKEGDGSSVAPALEILIQNDDRDLYLRHGGVMILAKCAEATELGQLTSHPSASVRLAAVVALRRQKAQEIDRFFNDSVAEVREEAVRGAYDAYITSALPQLANLAREIAQSIGEQNELYPLTARRAIYAAWRVGRLTDIEAVTEIAADAVIDLRVRRDALVALLDWNEPPVADPVTGTAVPLHDGRVEVTARNLGPTLRMSTSLLKEAPAAQRALMELVLKLSAQVGHAIENSSLAAIANDGTFSPTTRKLAGDLFAKSEKGSARHKQFLEKLMVDSETEMRGYARSSLLQVDRERALQLLSEALADDRTSLQEKQLTLGILGMESGEVAVSALVKTLEMATAGTLDSALLLEAVQAGEASSVPVVKAALADYRASLPVDEPLAEWFAACLEGGNPVIGEEVYLNHGAAQCARCHVLDGSGGQVGPDLSTIGRQHERDYLLRALLTPSSEVAIGYGIGTVTLVDGSSVTGLLQKPDSEGNTILLVGEEMRTIPKGMIKGQTSPISSMPPMGAILSKGQTRDLVAYLATRKEDLAEEKNK